MVGLYLNPPEHALVLSVDEKSQIQALDRSQPGLPLKKGRAGTMTHDFKRHGTTTLFAAFNVRDGQVIIPRADTVMQVRDRVVLLAATDAIKEVEKIFAVRLEFF